MIKGAWVNYLRTNLPCILGPVLNPHSELESCIVLCNYTDNLWQIMSSFVFNKTFYLPKQLIGAKCYFIFTQNFPGFRLHVLYVIFSTRHSQQILYKGKINVTSSLRNAWMHILISFLHVKKKSHSHLTQIKTLTGRGN